MESDAARWFPDKDLSAGLRHFYSHVVPLYMQPAIEGLGQAFAEAAQKGARWLPAFDAAWPEASFQVGSLSAKSPAHAFYLAAKWYLDDAREALMDIRLGEEASIEELDRILMEKCALPFPDLPTPTLADTHDAMQRMTLGRKRLAVAEGLDSIQEAALTENLRLALQRTEPRSRDAAARAERLLPTPQIDDLPTNAWVSFTDAGDGLALSKRTLRRRVQQGRLRRVFRGNRPCGYRQEDIVRLMNSEDNP